MVTDFQDIARVGVNHFSNLYKEDQRANVVSQLEIIAHFPSFINDYHNDTLEEPISCDELLVAIKSMHHDKSP